jgi:hypothetical protein
MTGAGMIKLLGSSSMPATLMTELNKDAKAFPRADERSDVCRHAW